MTAPDRSTGLPAQAVALTVRFVLTLLVGAGVLAWHAVPGSWRWRAALRA
ncbi:hypothetical protein OCAE111667_09260 [Occultella aeris]|uniref:Uncharacterized protein n=1 Tax=Occultella aeris TaxID=2761496 RepID=A0A7M4DI20_9MICO|nr:hypothetical protein [Occultella aeris]VZO36584.1 hypothetical protein HALOF300_01771 [Occultella aeris]